MYSSTSRLPDTLLPSTWLVALHIGRQPLTGNSSATDASHHKWSRTWAYGPVKLTEDALITEWLYDAYGRSQSCGLVKARVQFRHPSAWNSRNQQLAPELRGHVCLRRRPRPGVGCRPRWPTNGAQTRPPISVFRPKRLISVLEANFGHRFESRVAPIQFNDKTCQSFHGFGSAADARGHRPPRPPSDS